MKKAVIFDMDGVLIDSQPMYFNADIETLGKFGKEVNYSFVENYAGIANSDRFEKYKKDLDMECSALEMTVENAKIYNSKLESGKVKPIDGVLNLFKYLYCNKYKIAVASSSTYKLICKTLELLGLKEYVDIILSGEDMERGKPEPDIFLKAVEKLGLAKKECIIIEDSTNGVIAAKKAVVKCIGYRNKNSGNQDLTKADIIIDDFNSLLDDLSWLED